MENPKENKYQPTAAARAPGTWSKKSWSSIRQHTIKCREENCQDCQHKKQPERQNDSGKHRHKRNIFYKPQMNGITKNYQHQRYHDDHHKHQCKDSSSEPHQHIVGIFIHSADRIKSTVQCHKALSGGPDCHNCWQWYRCHCTTEHFVNNTQHPALESLRHQMLDQTVKICFFQFR